jgi:mono/diheme cytochrome c family protein
LGAADPYCEHPPEARVRASRTTAALAAAMIAAAAAVAAAPTHAAESDLVEQGRDLYADTCATCHGRDMVNSGGVAFDLRTFPKSDFARFRVSVLNGKGPAMPAWRDKLSDEDVAALWAYVKSGG